MSDNYLIMSCIPITIVNTHLTIQGFMYKMGGGFSFLSMSILGGGEEK